MEARVTVEDLASGYFAPLSLLFRDFGDIYDETPFGLTEALDDIRAAAARGQLPELDIRTLDTLTNSMIEFARDAIAEGKFTGVSEGDVVAILLYTAEFVGGGGLYKVMNARLSQKDRNQAIMFTKYIWLLLKGLSKCPSVRPGRMVFRGVKGVDLRSSYPTAKTFVWHQFSSCTIDIGVQETFTGNSGMRTLFMLELTTNRGRDISCFSTLPQEKEILLPPNSKFKVTASYNIAEGLQMVQAEELQPSDPIIVFRDPAPSAPSAEPISMPGGGGVINDVTLDAVHHNAANSATSATESSMSVLSPSPNPYPLVVNLQESEYCKKVIRAYEGVVCDKLASAEELLAFAIRDDEDNRLAQACLAVRYRHGGAILAKNEIKSAELARIALPWLQEQAALDNKHAIHLLGSFSYHGVLGPKDYSEACEYYRKGAKLGSSKSQSSLGYCYVSGLGVDPDPAQAFEWAQRSAQQGNCVGQYDLGCFYQQGIGSAVDDELAFFWLKRSADQGYGRSIRAVVACYRDGRGVGKSIADADKYQQRLPNGNNLINAPSAAVRNLEESEYCKKVMRAHLGVICDRLESGRELLAYASEHNHLAQACMALRCHRGGVVFAKNKEKSIQLATAALPWLEQQSAQNNRHATHLLGSFCYGGILEAIDRGKAFGYYEKGARLGSPLSQCSLGACFAYGDSVARNPAVAFQWSLRSAETGYCVGQYDIGCYYQQGIGCTVDDALAFIWLKRSADQGYAHAIRAVVACYRAGRGVEKSTAEADKYEQRLPNGRNLIE